MCTVKAICSSPAPAEPSGPLHGNRFADRRSAEYPHGVEDPTDREEAADQSEDDAVAGVEEFTARGPVRALGEQRPHEEEDPEEGHEDAHSSRGGGR